MVRIHPPPPQESDRFYNRSLFHFFPFPGVHVLMSKFVKRCIGFVQKETILCIAIALALIFSMIVPPNLSYIAYVDWDTLFLLFSLMAVTKGFQKAGLFLYLGNHLIKRATTSRKMLFSRFFTFYLQHGNYKRCFLTYFCSFRSHRAANGKSRIPHSPSGRHANRPLQI